MFIYSPTTIHTRVEHWMSLACLYVGAGFYALLISNVSFIVQNISRGKVRCVPL